MKNFQLIRLEDETGISGTGHIAEGVEFADGQCVISWLTRHHSIGVYPSMEELVAIHGHGGKTVVEYDDQGHGHGV